MLTTVEDELLLLCSRASADAETSARIESITTSTNEVDWDYVYQLARRHSVLPLIYTQLNSIPSARVPADQLARLKANYQKNVARNLFLTGELCRILETFAVAGIEAGGIVYGYPILLMRMLLAWSYFSSALIKLRVAGLSYLSPDNLPNLAIFHSLDNLHDTHFRLAFWLPQVREYTPIFVALGVLWELLFPLALFFKRARLIILALGIVFHLGTLFFMNIFFPYHLAMYLVFVDWGRWLGKVEGYLSTSRLRSLSKVSLEGKT